jgi:hypothetical protein
MSMSAKVCPICRTDSIERMLSDVLLSAHIDGLTHPSSGATAYHCKKGHVFLLITRRFQWGEPIRQGRGHSIIV